MGIKLVILGLLMEKERHPYEIQQIVKERHMEHYIKLAKGSLYYAFEQLEKNRFIEVSDIVRDTNRPDKTIYRITEAGREEFQRLLLKQFSEKEHMYKPLYAALSFTAYGGDEEAIAARIQQKLEETKGLQKTMHQVYELKYKQDSLANTYILVGVLVHLQAEVAWLTRLYEDAKAGNLKNIGIPLLEKWDFSS